VSPFLEPAPALSAAALESYAPVYGASVAALDQALQDAPGPVDLIDLTHGDPAAFPPPDSARAAIADALRLDAQAYTPYRGNAEIRARLAPRLAPLFGHAIDPGQELIITPGTQGGLFAALSALVSPGDRALVPDPDYYMYERLLSYLGAIPVRLPLSIEDYCPVLRPEALARAATERPAFLLLSNPNNPTGGVYGPDAIHALAEFALANDLVVIVDELYCRLIFPGITYTHLGSLPGMKNRTVTLLGPSKTESMSGYRIGVAVAPAKVIDAMERVISMASLRAAGYNQQALRHWMERDGDWLERRIASHHQISAHVVDRLRTMSCTTVTIPGGSSYVFPRVCHGGDPEALPVDDHRLALAFKANGVAVNPGYQFGPAGRGHFRINFSQDRATLDKALDRIAAVIAAT